MKIKLKKEHSVDGVKKPEGAILDVGPVFGRHLVAIGVAVMAHAPAKVTPRRMSATASSADKDSGRKPADTK